MSMKDEEIVIVSATRTPVGSFNGALASLTAHALGEVAIRAALQRAGVDPADVDEVIMGQVLTAGEGQNPARQAAIGAGIPVEATAFGVNQVCGSGLRAIALGAQQIATGDFEIVVAGGQESMSLSPHVAHLRNGQKMGALELVDSMIRDGLWEAFNGYHMGNTAENVARQWQITREEQESSPPPRRTRPRPPGRPASSRTRSLPSPSRRAKARRWRTWSCSSRVICHWRATFSAVLPMW